MRLHLDTDIGTHVDDLAALLLVLGAPGVEVTGITTCLDPGGRRAAYTRHVLAVAARKDVPVAAGAEAPMTPPLPPELLAGGPEPPAPPPSPAGSALRLLAESVEAGATIVAIGPGTNLALLAVERPRLVAQTHVVMMGGWFAPIPAGLPPWGPEQDHNVQWTPMQPPGSSPLQAR